MDPLSFSFWRLFYFFRDPERQAPPGNVIVSPADGYVLYVTRVEDGVVPLPVKKGVPLHLEEWMDFRPFNGNGILIGIYMTPLSVHFNRAPVGGTISRIIKRPASNNMSMARSFIRLVWGMKPYEKDCEYIVNNARTTTMIDGRIPAVMIQIADRFVNVIDTFVKQDQEVSIGQKVGMIRMGSQCDLFLPDLPELRIKCKAGDRVYAGTSILGTY